MRATDLLAMTPQADPFYVLQGRGSRGPLVCRIVGTVRLGQRHTLAPRALSPGRVDPVMKPTGDPYVNDGASWGTMKRASLAARYLNLIPAGSLVDRKNPDPIIFAENNRITRIHPYCLYGLSQSSLAEQHTADLDLDDKLYSPQFSLSEIDSGQAYLAASCGSRRPLRMTSLFLWPGDLALIWCRARTGGHSDTGASSGGAGNRGHRPMRILYISDFDPRGHKMPVGLARKMEFILRIAFSISTSPSPR